MTKRVTAVALPSHDELPRIEQRAHLRVRAEGAVHLVQDEREGVGELRNAGAHGIFVSTSFFLKSGSEVVVVTDLGGSHRMSGRATVRWVRPWNPKNPDVEAGVGLEFATTETEARAALADFVRETASPGFSHPLKSPT